MKKLMTLAIVSILYSAKPDCVRLEWNKSVTPSTNTIELLADTQKPADRQEIRDWFVLKHEHNFVLSDSHTNAIQSAIHDGATVTKLHSSSGLMHPFYGKR